jgi:hypothetical protein
MSLAPFVLGPTRPTLACSDARFSASINAVTVTKLNKYGFVIHDGRRPPHGSAISNCTRRCSTAKSGLSCKMPQPTAPSDSRSESSNKTQSRSHATPSPPPQQRASRAPERKASPRRSLPASPARSSNPQHAPPAQRHSKTEMVEEEDGEVHLHHSHPDHTNVHTECGRHGDDWLFGGFSLVEVFRGLFSRK